MPRTLFVSDLHLSGARPAQTRLFLDFLRAEATGASALYVLGDLFDYWLGDDDLDAPGSDCPGGEVAAGMRTVAAGGVSIRVMRGNRDFLIGDAFCAAAGAALLDDPAVAGVGGDSTVLLHGDTLCTDDVDYQAWRRIARSAAWQRDFLSQPLPARRQTMRALRERSSQAVKSKPPAVMDVTAAAVDDAFRQHGVRRMIHGHTHRPARHEHQVDGSTCERWVLPDWYEGGGCLVADAHGLRLQRF